MTITGKVKANVAPILNLNGTLNAFGPVVGAALAPGDGRADLRFQYGVHSRSTPSTVPLPTSINQTSVVIGGLQAPLYYVSPTQINAQVPFELVAGNTYQVIVNANGALSTPNPIQLTTVSPGIAASPSGQVIAQFPDNSPVSESTPAKPGDYVVIYLVGMGATDTSVATGAASPSSTAGPSAGQANIDAEWAIRLGDSLRGPDANRDWAISNQFRDYPPARRTAIRRS